MIQISKVSDLHISLLVQQVIKSFLFQPELHDWYNINTGCDILSKDGACKRFLAANWKE